MDALAECDGLAAPRFEDMTSRSANAEPLADALAGIFAQRPAHEHRRLAPLNSFSRSAARAHCGCTLDEHTDRVLDELGYPAAEIMRLRAASVVG